MKSMEKVKVTTLEELTPLIGKVIVDGKEIGIFLTESGDIHAINNICPPNKGHYQKEQWRLRLLPST